jgi:glycosyltransferase involved in cell wall biosynthesis
MVEIGVPAAAVTVVGNGIDTTRFHPFVRRRGEQGKTVLFAGNLVPVKGVEHLIAAFAAVVRRTGSARLIIVGSGRLEEALRRQARELGIAESVVFAGRQPHDAMPAWLVRADVFCLPSLNEGCPNVVLEALACGTPVVASRVGGIGDLITCDDQGFLVPPGNVSLLADALCRALGRRWDPRRVRAATTVMSWAQSAQQVCAVLRWAQGCAPVAPAGTAGDECAPAQGAVSR